MKRKYNFKLIIINHLKIIQIVDFICNVPKTVAFQATRKAHFTIELFKHFK